MITIRLLAFLPLLTCALWLLALLVLVAHRQRPLFGLTPLLILLGGLAGVLQLSLVGLFEVNFGNQNLVLQVNSFVILPALLLGLLIIYTVEGTTQARSTLLGIIVINI